MSKIVAGMKHAVAMAKADTLRSLADRVESGESGREIDRAVAERLNLSWDDRSGWSTSDGQAIKGVWPAGLWSTSLDATEALRVRVLPGWAVEKVVELRGETGVWRWVAQLRKIEDRPSDRVHDAHSHGPTEPAARLAAILRAVAASMEDTDA